MAVVDMEGVCMSLELTVTVSGSSRQYRTTDSTEETRGEAVLGQALLTLS